MCEKCSRQDTCLVPPPSPTSPLAAPGAPCSAAGCCPEVGQAGLEHSHFCTVCSPLPLMLLTARCLSLFAMFTAFCCCVQHLRELQPDVVMSFGVPTAGADCCGCMLSDALGGVPWIDVYGHPIIYSPMSVPQVGAAGLHASAGRSCKTPKPTRSTESLLYVAQQMYAYMVQPACEFHCLHVTTCMVRLSQRYCVTGGCTTVAAWSLSHIGATWSLYESGHAGEHHRNRTFTARCLQASN